MIRIPDFYRVAAAVAVIIVTAVVSVEVTKNRTADTPGQISLYTDAGEKQMLVLPDSSTVLLNSKSLVIYPESFSGRDREIFIVGCVLETDIESFLLVLFCLLSYFVAHHFFLNLSRCILQLISNSNSLHQRN